MARHPRRNLTAHALAWRPVIEQPALWRHVLVAAGLPARDRAVAPFDRGSHHAAALSWADGDTAWANADGGIIAPTVSVVAVGAVPPNLNIDALGHLEFLSLGRSGERRSRQHHCCCRCRQDESDLHHRVTSLDLMPPARVIAGPRALLTSILLVTRVPCRGSGAGGRTLAHKQRLAAVGRSQVPPARLTHRAPNAPLKHDHPSGEAHPPS